MQRLRINNSLLWVPLVLMVFGAFVTSSQDWDLRHTSYMGAGLFKQGLSFYTQNDANTTANYLPSTYLLTQIALLPATLLQSIFGLQQCSVLNKMPCFWEAVAIKFSTVAMAFAWVFLNMKNPAKSAMALLLIPTVLYAWLLFGAYDGIGAFATLIGGTLFFKKNLFDSLSPRAKTLIATAGLLLAAMGIGAKFFPLPLFVGCALAYCKSVRKFFLGLFVISVITVAQIAIAQAYGCLWHELIRVGTTASSLWQTVRTLAPLLPVLTTCVALFVVYVREKNSAQLGALAALASYALLLPILWPHPQWYMYYGIALFAALATHPLSKNAQRILMFLVFLQAVSIVMAVQWYPNNADITMTGRMAGFNIPALGDVFPSAQPHTQRYGRKILSSTVVLSFVVFAYEWLKARKHRTNTTQDTIVIEANETQFDNIAWAGALSLFLWVAAVGAIIWKTNF